MKILIADTFERPGIKALQELGCELVHEPLLKNDALCGAIERTQCDVLIVRGTQVTARMLQASSQLGLVIRAGAGYDTIDVQAASKHSIFVANCPGKNAEAVAELTMGLILALDRRLADATADLKRGVWDKKLYSKARGLKGRTLGIVGMGRIGQRVAQRALAFEMEVVAWSRSLTDDKAAAMGVRRLASIVAVASSCDVFTVHLAAAPETQKCINTAVFKAFNKPGAIFINTARGNVVDYEALLQAMPTRDLRVGLDVYEAEPKTGVGDSFADRIIQSGGIVCGTPHIGASTQQAQNAIATEAASIVENYLFTGDVLNCVNRCTRSPARSVLLVRHLNRPGVLAHVLKDISFADVNVEEMENVIYEGAYCACATISLDGVLSDALIGKIQAGNPHILGISQKTKNAE